MKRSLYWETVFAWATWVAVLGAAVTALHPMNIYAHLSTVGRVIAVTGGALSGLIGGTIFGFVLGLIAGGLRVAFAGMAQHAPPGPAERRAPFTRPWIVALIIGLLVGGFNLATSPQREAFAKSSAACSAAEENVNAAGKFGSNHLYQDAYDRATQAIREAPDCNSGSRDVYLGMAYLIRAGVGQRIGKDFANDATAAESHLAACVKNEVDGPTMKQCTTMLQSADRYATQHYCDDSYRLSMEAESEFEKAPRTAREAATRAVTAAGRCKNAYAYAYRGIALMERNVATYSTGQRGVADFAESKRLLTRCVSELAGATHDAGLLRNCKSALEADDVWLAKTGP